MQVKREIHFCYDKSFSGTNYHFVSTIHVRCTSLFTTSHFFLKKLIKIFISTYPKNSLRVPSACSMKHTGWRKTKLDHRIIKKKNTTGYLKKLRDCYIVSNLLSSGYRPVCINVVCIEGVKFTHFNRTNFLRNTGKSLYSLCSSINFFCYQNYKWVRDPLSV